MQGKLVMATNTGRTWSTQRGDTFEAWDVMLDVDGRAVQGEASGKPGSDRLSKLVGQEVTFEHVPSSNNYPDKIKGIKELDSSPKGGGYSGGGGKKYDSLGPQIGGALKCAVDLYIHGKIQEGEIGGWTMKLVKIQNQVRAALEAESAPQAHTSAPSDGMGADGPPQPPAGNVGAPSAGMSLDDLDRMAPPF